MFYWFSYYSMTSIAADFRKCSYLNYIILYAQREAKILLFLLFRLYCFILLVASSAVV